MTSIFKLLTLFTVLTLTSGFLQAETDIWVQHDANSVIQMEVESAAKKFGYAYVKTKTTEAHGFQTAWSHLKISNLDSTYLQFLNYLFEIQDVQGVRPVSDQPGKLMRLVLNADMTDTDFEKLSLEFLAKNIFIRKFQKFYNAYVEIYIQPEQIPSFVEDMKQRNIFDSYSVDQQLYYFEDMESARDRTGKLVVPEFLNADFILKNLRQKFNFEEVSRATEGENTAIRIALKNATRKEAEAFFLHLSSYAFSNNSRHRFLSEVQYQPDEKAAHTPQASILSSSPRKRYLYTFVPRDAHKLIASRGLNSYLKTLQVEALKLKERGYRVISIFAQAEMGDGYDIGIVFEAEQRQLNLKALIKLGDIFAPGTPGHYPGPVTTCEVYFR